MADWLVGDSPAVVRANYNKLNSKFINVETDFGAVHDGNTDDTVAIQAAINACVAAGGGIVYFPNGIYLISGALQTSVGGQNPNCQLYIPVNTWDANRCTIHFLGQTAHIFPVNGPVGGAGSSLPITTTGVILYSTLTSASGTNPSVISSSGGAGISQFHDIIFEIMSIRVKSTANGPVLSGVNGGHMSFVDFRNFSVTLDVNQWDSNSPTNECAGIIAGAIGNTMCGMKRVVIQGFKYGLIPGEHIFMDNINIFGCYYGLVLPRGNYTYNGGIVGINWCKTSIYSPTSTFMGMTAGVCNLNISALELEDASLTDKWYDYGTSILDASNQIYGKIRYIMGLMNVGTDYTKFSISAGQTHLVIERSDNA
jgi:hypothetical protein